jgi:hypothetical protein
MNCGLKPRNASCRDGTALYTGSSKLTAQNALLQKPDLILRAPQPGFFMGAMEKKFLTIVKPHAFIGGVLLTPNF